MILNFEVNNQIIQRLDNNILVNKTKDYVVCSFSFNTSEWEDTEKFAIFKNSWNEAYLVNLGTKLESTVTPPEDVLKGTFFKVSVYGGDRVTSNELTIALLPSGYTTNIKHPEENGVDVFTQLFNALNEKVSSITYSDGVMRVFSSDGEISAFNLVTTDELSNVAVSGSYTDLVDVPETFPPSQHDHLSEDILDFESNVEGDMDLLLICLTDKITEI